jgi:serine/threonine protein kinase/Tol biopolymer transport system component
MPLAPGAELGPYTIIAKLGEGGMGEVYRATDRRLGRTVAIKVLPQDTTPDRRVLQRFEREARAASRLSHPNICPIFDVGEQDGRPFLVMEYLEGVTLAARLERRRLPLRDALRIAIEVAGALEHAHRAGLVHRDVKPANIMLTVSGARLLDFGLAQLHAEPPPAGDSAVTVTETETLTAEGTILGTVPYMAPEQLEEGDTDARTDIFALGTVLYEMSAGRRPFEGNSRASVIAAVLSHTPAPLSATRPAAADDTRTLSLLDRIVARCLEKDPGARWQTAADLRHALDLVAGGSLATTPVATPAARSPRWRVSSAVAVMLVVTAIGVIVDLALDRRAGVNSDHVLRYIVPPPESSTFNPSVASIALSPDGTKLVFVASARQGGMALWLRTADDVTPRQLRGTEGASQPFWSADGRFVAYGTTEGQLKKIDVATGLSDVLTTGRINTGSWSRDGVLLFTSTPESYVLRLSSAGGTPAAATTLDASRQETRHNAPQFLPDGRHFLYYARSSNAEFNGIVYVGALDSTERVQVCQCRSTALYASGFLLFVRDGNLVAQRFDLDGFRLTGNPAVLAEQIDHNPMGRGAFSVSETGSIAYRTTGETRLVWIDRGGRPIAPLGEPGIIGNPALSPDERTVAIDRRDPVSGETNLWLIDVATGLQSAFTTSGGAAKPLWTPPDGKSLVYRAGSSLTLRAATGTSAERRLVDGVVPFEGPGGWTADGRTLLYDSFAMDTAGDVSRVSVDDPKPVPVLRTGYFELQARLSPGDGRWVAYVSNESGRYDVYVRAFRGGEGQWLISPDGGSDPAWSRDGRELFYLAPDQSLMAVAVNSGPAFERARPVRLFDTRMSTLANPYFTRNQYVVSADGQRFLINQPTGQPAPITVIVNWPAAMDKVR